MGEGVNETQECRVYEEGAWPSLIEYTLFLKHRKCYEVAGEVAEGKSVLDFGCGSGYGAALMAGSAASVVGVDASARAIDFCVGHYGAENLTFEAITPDCTLRFEDGAFDVVTSFQVIEHMPDVRAYLQLLKRVLKPGGRLLLATPNRAHRLRPLQMNWQPAHLREYSAKTLERELSAVFSEFTISGLYGTDAFNRIYYRHYHQSFLGAYVLLPIKLLTRKALPEGLYGRVKQALGAGKGEEGAPLPQEELDRFGTEDVCIGEDLVTALDFFAECVKE